MTDTNEAHDLIQTLDMLSEDVDDMRYWMADVPGAEQVRLEIAVLVSRAHGLAHSLLNELERA